MSDADSQRAFEALRRRVERGERLAAADIAGRSPEELRSLLLTLAGNEAQSRLLARISRRLAETDEPAVDELCREIAEHLECPFFLVHLTDPATGRLRLHASGGISGELRARVEWLDADETVCGAAARQRAPVVCEDVQRGHDPSTDLIRSLGLDACVCEPLVTERGSLGRLSLGTATRAAFSARELEFIGQVAAHLAAGLSRIADLRALREQEARLRRSIESAPAMPDRQPRHGEDVVAADLDAMTWLQRVSTAFISDGGQAAVLETIIDAAIAITGADFGNIQLIDPASGNLVIAAQRGFPPWWVEFWNAVPRGRGACGAALERLERIVVEDIEQSALFAGPELDAQRRAGVRAVQSTPLVGRSGKRVGAFSTHYKVPHHPDAHRLTLLDLLARQAADIIERKQSEDALRSREDRLRAILNTAADAIITIDRRGVISGVNPATERMFGYTESELLGQNVEMLMPPPDRDEHDRRLARYRNTASARIVGKGRELLGLRKDGTLFPIALTVSEIDHLGLFSGTIRDMTELRELQKQILEIAAEEDRRIGHELHDNIQQRLTGLGLLAVTLSDALHERSPREADTAARLARGLEETVRHVRSLARGLVPVDVDAHGLRAALANLAAEMNGRAGLTCEFEVNGTAEVADNFVATHLFRIAQEAVNNAVKHAKCDRIRISLDGGREAIVLGVLDNGIGIGEHAGSHAGMGLKIVTHRAQVLGGTLRIERGGERGTRVSCTVRQPGRAPG